MVKVLISIIFKKLHEWKNIVLSHLQNDALWQWVCAHGVICLTSIHALSMRHTVCDNHTLSVVMLHTVCYTYSVMCFIVHPTIWQIMTLELSHFITQVSLLDPVYFPHPIPQKTTQIQWVCFNETVISVATLYV